MSEELHPDVQRLKKACEDLSEHFDTIQIFATRVADEVDEEKGGTVNCNWGSGNWFARYGHIRYWMIKQDEQARNEVRDE